MTSLNDMSFKSHRHKQLWGRVTVRNTLQEICKDSLTLLYINFLVVCSELCHSELNAPKLQSTFCISLTFSFFLIDRATVRHVDDRSLLLLSPAKRGRVGDIPIFTSVQGWSQLWQELQWSLRSALTQTFPWGCWNTYCRPNIPGRRWGNTYIISSENIQEV